MVAAGFPTVITPVMTMLNTLIVVNHSNIRESYSALSLAISSSNTSFTIPWISVLNSGSPIIISKIEALAVYRVNSKFFFGTRLLRWLPNHKQVVKLLLTLKGNLG